MTREELELRVSAALPNGCDSYAIIRPVIRLVVEACCAKADEYLGGFTNLSAVLRHTFLPTEKPDA
jgi:hypothetical protein